MLRAHTVEQVRSGGGGPAGGTAGGRADAAGGARAGVRRARPARARVRRPGAAAGRGRRQRRRRAARRCGARQAGRRGSRRCCSRPGPAHAAGLAALHGAAAGSWRSRTPSARTSWSTGSWASAGGPGCATRPLRRWRAPTGCRSSRSTSRPASTPTPARLDGPHVRATLTVTFGTHKVALLADPAAQRRARSTSSTSGSRLPGGARSRRCRRPTWRRCCRTARRQRAQVLPRRRRGPHRLGAVPRRRRALGRRGGLRAGRDGPLRRRRRRPRARRAPGDRVRRRPGPGVGGRVGRRRRRGRGAGAVAGATGSRSWSTPTRWRPSTDPSEGRPCSPRTPASSPRCSSTDRAGVEAAPLRHARAAAGTVRRRRAAQGPPHGRRRARRPGPGQHHRRAVARHGRAPVTCSAGLVGALLASGPGAARRRERRRVAARRGRDPGLGRRPAHGVGRRGGPAQAVRSVRTA